MKKKVRNIYREFLVYSLFSARKLLLRGKWGAYIADMGKFPVWRKSRLQDADIPHAPIPWMVFGAVDFLKGWLKKDMEVYEYGSGSSTIFFAERVKKIISVEHHEEWHHTVERFRQQQQINNIEYHLYPPKPSAESSGSYVDHRLYLSCMGEYKGFEFSSYVKSIDQYPDEQFDLVVVDGRSRASCIQHARQKVKTGGVLLVDNSDREHYLAAFPELFDKRKWKHVTFQGHAPYNPPSCIDSTSLFIKN